MKNTIISFILLCLICLPSILSANYCEYCGRSAFICGEDAYYDYQQEYSSCEGLSSSSVPNVSPLETLACYWGARIDLNRDLRSCSKEKSRCLSGCE
jgi:hypothetical protein